MIRFRGLERRKGSRFLKLFAVCYSVVFMLEKDP